MDLQWIDSLCFSWSCTVDSSEFCLNFGFLKNKYTWTKSLFLRMLVIEKMCKFENLLSAGFGKPHTFEICALTKTLDPTATWGWKLETEETFPWEQPLDNFVFHQAAVSLWMVKLKCHNSQWGSSLKVIQKWTFISFTLGQSEAAVGPIWIPW